MEKTGKKSVNATIRCAFFPVQPVKQPVGWQMGGKMSWLSAFLQYKGGRKKAGRPANQRLFSFGF
jgi:hypothetical protein